MGQQEGCCIRTLRPQRRLLRTVRLHRPEPPHQAGTGGGIREGTSREEDLVLEAAPWIRCHRQRHPQEERKELPETEANPVDEGRSQRKVLGVRRCLCAPWKWQLVLRQCPIVGSWTKGCFDCLW